MSDPASSSSGSQEPVYNQSVFALRRESFMAAAASSRNSRTSDASVLRSSTCSNTSAPRSSGHNFYSGRLSSVNAGSSIVPIYENEQGSSIPKSNNNQSQCRYRNEESSDAGKSPIFNASKVAPESKVISYISVPQPSTRISTITSPSTSEAHRVPTSPDSNELALPTYQECLSSQSVPPSRTIPAIPSPSPASSRSNNFQQIIETNNCNLNNSGFPRMRHVENAGSNRAGFYIQSTLADSLADLSLAALPKNVDPEENAMMQNKKRRIDVCMELITTEETYIDDMKTVIELFYNPIKEKKWISEKEANLIFSNLAQILTVNQLFYQAMRENLEEDGITGIEEIFITMADYFKIYTFYCSNHVNSLKLYNECLANYNKLRYYVNEMCSQPEFKGMNLESFLLKPVQRICKYPLFLRELIKYTDDAVEKESLNVALSRIEVIVQTINEKSKEAAEVQKAVDALAQISFGLGNRRLPSQNRKLLLESKFLVRTKGNRSKKLKTRRLFLFSDVLIVAKKRWFYKDKYKCCDIISLCDGISLGALEEQDRLDAYKGFRLESATVKGKPYSIYSEASDRVERWVNTLQEASTHAVSFFTSPREKLLFNTIRLSRTSQCNMMESIRNDFSRR